MRAPMHPRSRWAGMHRNGGVTADWGDYRAFELWCREHHVEPGDRLRRVDTSRPWGPDNIKDIQRKATHVSESPYYDRWTSMHHDADVDPEWDDFRVFELWCRERHVEPGDRLRRVDTSSPWGPGNVEVGRRDDPAPTESPYYKRWSAMRRQGGVQPDEWGQLREFERWCLEHRVDPADRLHRVDTSRPWGPDNVEIDHVKESVTAESPHYARWSNMRYRDGVNPEWEDFRAFELWCREHHVEPGDRLRRVDTSRPWGPGNVKGIQREAIGARRSPYYVRWIAMRRQGGVQPEWDQFRAFELWCKERHVKPGDRLRRTDMKRPWGPGNVNGIQRETSTMESSPHYTRWANMRRQGGVRPKWEDFRTFERWCRKHHVKPGDQLRRVDTSRPWGPGNVKGIQRKTTGATKSPYYARWAYMRYQGVQSEWDDFDVFELWCREHDFESGDQLRRLDATLPWGPDNTAIIRRETVGATKSPYYRRWINMRRQGGVQPEWDDFPVFERWCVEHHVKPGDQLRRTDTKRLWGPDNVQVLTR